MMEMESLESRRMLAVLPAGFAETVVASGLAAPAAMGFSPDGRLFVAEQGGALRVIKNGQLLAQPFVRLTVDSRVERGLLGVAFHPRFHRNGHVYVYYRSEEHTSELQSLAYLVCRLLLEKKNHS